LLLAIAAENEAKAILEACSQEEPLPGLPALWETTELAPGVGLLLTGVGKANACGATALALARAGSPPAGVISIGIGGTLDPDRAGIGQVVLASESVFADEGVASPSGFATMSEAGFPVVTPSLGESIPATPVMLDRLGGLADHIGVIATVSSCSGTDGAARAIHARTGAIVEAMEGAGVGLACARLGAPFAEIRVVSNTTGDRDRQTWDMGPALRRLGEIASMIASRPKP